MKIVSNSQADPAFPTSKTSFQITKKMRHFASLLSKFSKQFRLREHRFK